jgi:DNA polymerase-3 subunit alpha
MPEPSFVHLHLHTHYSLLDGATEINRLVQRTKALNMPAVAITDHGNMFAAIEFYEAATRAGIKPLLGLEAYLAPERRDNKAARGVGKDHSYHQLLLAQNLTGYHNLMKLASIGYLEGFYYKPRIDKEVLEEFSEGLICTSTCLGAELPQLLLHRDYKDARAAAETYLKIFGPERFLIEVQDHGIEEQKQTNPALFDLAQDLGVRVVATNDVHYLLKEDTEAHDVLLCISTNALVKDENRFRFHGEEFYLKSPAEMAKLFPDRPDVMSNTLAVADMCNVELDFTKRFAPVYKPPADHTDRTYLKELVYAGAKERYGQITDEIRERIDYELEVIGSKGFSSYFLIVWDFVNDARSRGIPCGARGSGCSSVVCFCLYLSAPDPIRYGLYFERFMDPDRDEMPDIDIDICQEGRQQTIDYVRAKYGHVAQIITFGTLKARAAVKDVARVMGVDFERANKISQLIPAELKMTIDKALGIEPELQKLCEEDDEIAKVIDIAKRIEGLSRHVGIHAAGVVVADKPLDSFVPLYSPPNSGDKQMVTQFDGPTVEKIGLLKMDFLGLRTLTVLERARQLAERGHGVKINLETLDLTDQRVYEIFVQGDTKGIFQFESDGMRDVVRRMRPDRIEDLIAANALYRPGPMVNIDAYVSRKHGEAWSTPHDIMSDVLSETFGIMVYQEQVSRLVNRLGGIELKRAFRLAKAISKKKTDLIESMREPFLDGCVEKGVDRGTADQIFEDILRFGGYAFNKAHSTGYSIVAFQTAFMKKYYPIEFMAALLTFEMGDSSKVTEYIEACRNMNIAVRPPDVNVSNYDFTPVKGDDDQARLRFGLGAIKGLGEKAVHNIVTERNDNGAFEHIFDFCERVDLSIVNRGAVEALIKSGAFDSTGAMRKALIVVLDAAMESGQSAQRDRKSGQMSLLEAFAGDDGPPEVHYPTIPADQQWNEAELLANEKEVLGFYITNHPLAHCQTDILRYASTTIDGLRQMSEGTEVVVGAMITKLRTVMTKTGRNAGKKMGIVHLEDTTGSTEGIAFSADLERFRPHLVIDRIAFFRGQVDRKRDEPALRLSDIIELEAARTQLTADVMINLSAARHAPTILSDLETLLAKHAGGTPVIFRIRTGANMLAAVRPGGYAVEPSQALQEDLIALLGDDTVEFRGAGCARVA